MGPSDHLLHPVRIALVIGVVTIWILLVLARLGQLQILRHEEFVQSALERQQVNRSVPGPRGIIYDSRMDQLASSTTVHAVVAEPRRIKDIPAAARGLAAILNLDPVRLLERISDPARRAFLIVKHRIDPKDEARVEALGIDGLYLIEESMRVYPNRELASQVLGFVNMEGAGGAGLELQYDRELRGSPGEISFSVDARRRSFHGIVQKAPVQGCSLVLSLDRTIQYILERELSRGVQEVRALSGTAIVMEPDSGRILAMANYPTFNSNTYNEADPALWRNKAVSDLFEPGSTFKVVVAASALEAGLTRPRELIDCQMGSIVIGKHVFHDHKPYGLLTFSQILENSSNVGAAKLGLRLGEERMYYALRNFGFGSQTGIDLPGEIAGLVRDYHDWSGLSIGAISFGQEVGVTSIQILRAIGAIANGGYMVVPSVVDRVIDGKGNLVRITKPSRKRIISPETAFVVRDAFEGVVLRGTGRRAALEGYRCAGKTGTAQKIVGGQYSDTKYLASFIGFAPLPVPKVVALVQIDEPRGKIYGGDAAAPVFARIVQDVLIQMKVPPDRTVSRPVINPRLALNTGDYFPNATPVAPIQLTGDGGPSADPVGEVVLPAGPDSLVMPDLRGLAKRQVILRCQDLGLRLQMKGAGAAIVQDPLPGTVIGKGDACSVTFARGLTAGGTGPSASGSTDNSEKPEGLRRNEVRQN